MMTMIAMGLWLSDVDLFLVLFMVFCSNNRSDSCQIVWRKLLTSLWWVSHLQTGGSSPSNQRRSWLSRSPRVLEEPFHQGLFFDKSHFFLCTGVLSRCSGAWAKEWGTRWCRTGRDQSSSASTKDFAPSRFVCSRFSNTTMSFFYLPSPSDWSR